MGRKTINNNGILLFVLMTLIVCLQAGCMKTMDSTEVGVIYKSLPWGFGGFKGYVNSGEMFIYSPLWTNIYTVDTKVKSISWSRDTSLNTRAMDGNEVWLSVTVQYHNDPSKVGIVLANIGSEDENIETALTAFSRGNIRAYLGELFTEHFYDNKMRYEKSEIAKNALNRALNPYGILIDTVIIDAHRFQTEYQDKIDLTKTTEQQAQQMKNKIDTIRAKKKKEIQEMIAHVNKVVAKADGKTMQAKLRGDAYYDAKKAESKAILIEGKNEAEAIMKHIEALKRSGGASIIRLEIGKSLIDSKSKFFLIDKGDKSNGSGKLDFSKIDYNKFLDQMGLMFLADERR